MAKLDEIIQDDFGQEIIVELIATDSDDTINDNTSFELKIEKPDDSVITRTTGITKVDSKTVKYSTEAAETDLLGEYKVHMRFKKSTDADITGRMFIYHVIPLFSGLGDFRRGKTLLSGAST